MLLMRSETRTVRQFGVQLWRITGEPVIFQHSELYKIIGQKVEVFWHPDTVGEAHIYRRDGERFKFVCSAQHAPLMRLGASSEDLHRAVYTPRKQAKAFHRGVKADAESTYKSLLERIGESVRERLDLPHPEEAMPIAVNQWVPRITQGSHMAREQAEARKSQVSVDVDPERALADMAQQTRSEELEQINRSYEKSMRLLDLFDDQS